MTPRSWSSASTTGTVIQVVVGHEQGHVDDVGGRGDPNRVGVVDVAQTGPGVSVQQPDDADRPDQTVRSVNGVHGDKGLRLHVPGQADAAECLVDAVPLPGR
jgi:hypothetical protein